MKSLIKLASASLLALALGTAALANPIVGSVSFLGINTLNGPLDTATQVTATNAIVGSASGDFALNGVGLNDPVTFATPFNLNSGAVASFWSVGGFTFDLISSAIVTQNANFLNVSGTGTINGYLYDPTPGTWNFTIPGAGANGIFSFAAATTYVPEGGMTAVMLGLGLLALGLAARRKQA